MRIFLTGGSGYIGRATIAELVRRGHVVQALARGEQSAQAVTGAGAAAVRGSLTDLDVLNHAAAGAEAVIHLAQADSPEMDLAAAEAMQDGAGAGAYVHTGGSWVYGDTDGVADETAPWNPPSVVAWRRPVEDAVLARAADGARPVIVQPGLLYGGDNRLIDHFFITPGKLNGAIPYIGNGANRWALVHVDDVATLYAAAISGKAGSVYIGVGEGHPTMKQVAEAAARGAGLEGKTASITIEQARAQMGPVADAFALDQRLSAAKARRELGWAPTHADPLADLSCR
ncbi:NAD-dependent epimerase/dehydratase family protein [Actinospica sp. MGRD01-02]|uniref:NAD-dependent epimerase/dehydratase family protein n=1 Tax=Actinospica acidithermotolerans TaxID=2828514 RepID=A0A941E4C3_9ACTN|nr:NAD-dependent epimerase/dehydratase family protein [Actinospica acidithermotolerans]MBR7825980.1 NAD-dependent epimerase/dehydratase family protein [Actinospica acidithermotolerans]